MTGHITVTVSFDLVGLDEITDALKDKIEREALIMAEMSAPDTVNTANVKYEVSIKRIDNDEH